MKSAKHLRITAYILIQLFLTANLAWAVQDSISNNYRHTLSPVLQIDNSAYFLPFYNVDVVKPWNKLNVVFKEQIKTADYFTNTIEVSFKYDQVGIFSKILNAINGYGNLIWFEEGQIKDKRRFNLGVITETKYQRSIIIDKLRKIDDLPREKSKKIKKIKRILTLSSSGKVDVLKGITEYLASLDINVAKFLTPIKIEDGESQFVFELDVPDDLDIEQLRLDLSLLNMGGEERVQMTKGQLIDRVLDSFLIKGIRIQINREDRKVLRSGLKTVAARHISQARKDRKTPFLMHPIEIAKILSNEIDLFAPELVAYLAQALQLKKEKVSRMLLTATLLHDAVEDEDITQKKVEADFGKLVAGIVNLVTKKPEHKGEKGEAVYLRNLVNRTDTIGLLAQILKIADRIHNLRTLKDNSPEFQRKVIFSTIDNFIPEFIDKIDIDKVKNRYMREVFTRAIALFNEQLKIMLLELEINPEQREKYAWEEECRLNPKVLAMAEKNKIIAYGTWSEKEGKDSLYEIIKQGYIKAKETEVGMAVLAGLLRRQRADEDYDDYQVESSGSYGPCYVLFDPKVNNLRIRGELERNKAISPGYYQAMPIDQSNWGLKNDLHAGYLVPADTNRQDIAKKLKLDVENNEMSSHDALEAMAKIITYAEFLASNGSLKPQTVSPLKPQTVSTVILSCAEQSI